MKKDGKSQVECKHVRVLCGLMVDFVVLDGCSGTRYRTFGANVPQNEGHVYLLHRRKTHTIT